MDPYAQASSGARSRWDEALFGFRLGEDDTTFDDRDSAPYAPLAAVVDRAFTWGDDRPPRTPWHETLIYELHVKGFTQLHPDVPEPLRGTYLGLASEPAIQHLDVARRDRGRADAGAPPHRRLAPRRSAG